MKFRAFLFAGSIALNSAGVVVFTMRPALVPPAVHDFFERHFCRRAEVPASPPKTGFPKPIARKTLVARLCSAGFPAEIIRAMILAEISARYDAKMRAMFEPDPGTPFWKLGPSFFTSGDKRMEEYGQLQRERTKLQRGLFADPFFATDDVTAAQRRQFGDLPRQKIDLLQRIEDDYAEMSAAIRSATNGILLAEDREKLELLMRERRADLAGVLSPEQLADYEMHSSPLSNMLTRQLASFNASEAEFRAIFQAQQAYSDKLSPTVLSSGGNYQDRQAAYQELNERSKSALGDARYADYIRETDRTYQQLLRLAQRENLPPEAATRAFNIRETVAQESGRIADDPGLSNRRSRISWGPDPENGPAAALRRQFPSLTDETIDQMVAIRERYDQQRAELYGNVRGPGGMLPDEQAKIEALDKAMRGEIAAILKPQELEEYDLRTSNTANQLRYNLVAFNASEQEFRVLYKLQSTFDEQFAMLRGLASDEQMRARSEAQKQLSEQIRAALGADRFVEYQRSTDHNYRQTTQLVARLNLPPETANSLYTIQKEFEQRRSDMYRSSGGGGSPAFDSMAVQGTALQQEAIAKVTSVLGSSKHVEAYKQYGGSWINNMVPRPPPVRATPQKP